MSTTSKEIIFQEEALQSLTKGIEQMAGVVGITLGPRGRNVGLDASYGSPTITSDGHSIANDIELSDSFKNVGVSMAKEMVSKIKEKVGDGTTTGIVLLNSLVLGGAKNIAAGASPIAIKRGMDKTLEALLKAIDAVAIPIKDRKETKNIATVSASGVTEVGEHISKGFEKVGNAGVVTIEEGKSIDTTIEIVEGMQLDQGYVSPYFCSNAEKMIVELSEPSLLITDKKIASAQEILSILQHIATTGSELLIIAEDIEGDALSTLVVNKLRGMLKIAAIKAPGFGDRRKALLEDIAALTGAQVVTEEKGMILKDADVDVLGKAERILISKDKTTIIDGKGNAKDVKARIAQIDHEIKATTSSYDKEKLEERKAKLTGGVAVIKVGAPTESEMKKKKQLFEDSLNATRAALEEGVVPGGGIALLRATLGLKVPNLSKEEEVGSALLLKAAEAPFRQIVQNAGHDSSLFLQQVLAKGKNFGFNAVTESIEDLVQSGVIDPVKIIKTSLVHAVSMAGMVLLSEAVIVNSKDEK